MSIAQPIPLPVARAIRLELILTDPEVVTELERRAEGAERDELASQALRIGVLALRHASGALDSDAIRRAGDEAVKSLETVLRENATRMTGGVAELIARYFDPSTGFLPQRLEQLVKGDGDLELLLAKHLDGDRSTIHQTLEKLLGPNSPLLKLLSADQAGNVVDTMRAAVDEVVTRQQQAVLRQFSLDVQDSALARLLSEVGAANGKLRNELAVDVDRVAREFSLDNESGALSRLVTRVETAQKTIVEQLSLDHDGSALQRMSSMLEITNATIEKNLTLDVETSPLARLRRELQLVTARIEDSQTKFQGELRATVAALQTRREAASKSPAGGLTFEDAMETFLRTDSQRAGDVYERVSTQPGPSGAKKGDHVVVLGPETAAPGARIVVESKAQKRYTEANALLELEAARANRNAQIGVFVFKQSAAPQGLDGFRRLGDDILAVWDPEDAGTDIWLRAALSIARALAVRERVADDRCEANLQQIDRSVRDIEKQMKAISDIAKAARVVQTKGTSILDAAESIKSTIERQLALLKINLDALRDDDSQ